MSEGLTMQKQEFTINEEFKNLLPKHSEKDFKLLEEEVLKEGVRRPLFVWKEQNILIDGHTRLSICQKHNLPYEIGYKSFESEDHVIAWIIQNQFDNEIHRKLTEKEKHYLIGKKYSVEKKINGGQGGNQYKKVQLPQNEEAAKSTTSSPKFKSTSARVAAEEGVSKSTVERAERFTKAVDILAETISPEIKIELLAGQVKIPRDELNDLALVAQSEPELAKTQYEEFKMGRKKKSQKRAGRPKKQTEESNIVQLPSKPEPTTPPVETILEDEPEREVKFTCPICNWVEDGTYIFSGVHYKHPQSFMKELKDAKPATEALLISHSSISRMKAIMPDDPDRILAYEEVIAWCQSAIEDAKQYQLKKQRRR